MHAGQPAPTRSSDCPAGGAGMLRALSAPDRKLITGRPAPSELTGARFGPLGAVPRGAGLVEFRVWAPDAEEVAVELAGGTRPLGREPEGTFAGRLPAGPGDDYRFLLDGRSLADPCSRWQPGGLRGASRILDPAACVWTADAPSLDLAESGCLRAARRHVHPGGHVRRCRRPPAGAARARGDRDRADAGRHVPGRTGLGLRRRLHLGAASSLRRARTGSPASSTQPMRTGSA